MNIVKLQNDLKDLSDRQLMGAMQAGSAPQYLVLSEMQRRKKMRSEAQSKPQQSTSVAEDIMQPSMGLASMPQNPMMQASGDGIVGFAQGRSVARSPASPTARSVSYRNLLGREAARRGWSTDEASIFDQWRDNVAEIESKNVPTRTQNDSPTGIGRGKYQYEGASGSSTNLTARNRLRAFLSRFDLTLENLPQADREELAKEDPDFSKLSEDTQDIIFLADKSEADDTRLNDLVRGDISQADAWVDWHWKGSAKKRPAKKRMWADRIGDTAPAKPVATPEEHAELMADIAEADTTPTPSPAPAPELPSQTAAEGIAALGEGRGSYGHGEMQPTRVLDPQTAGDALAGLGAVKMPLTASEAAPRYSDSELISRYLDGEPVDWTNVPGDHPLRGIPYGFSDDAVHDGGPAWTALDRDQGGAYDVYDVHGLQSGSPTIYENTINKQSYRYPVRPTGDTSLKTLVPSEYEGVVGLLPGERIVNEAEPATADSFQEISSPLERSDYRHYVDSLDSQPMMSAADAIAALGEGRGSYGHGEMKPTPLPKMSAADAIAALGEGRGSYGHGEMQPTPEPKSEPWQRKFGAPGANPRADGGINNLINKLDEQERYRWTTPEEHAEMMTYIEDAERSASPAAKDTTSVTPAAPAAPAAEDKAPRPEDDINMQFTDDVKAPAKETAAKSGDAPRYGMSDFLMRAGLGMAASKRGDFLSAVAEGGLAGLQGMDAARKAEREAEQARMLEEGRTERQRMAGESALEAAKIRGEYSYMASLQKAAMKLQEDLANPLTVTSPEVRALKEKQLKEIAQQILAIQGKGVKDKSAGVVTGSRPNPQ